MVAKQVSKATVEIHRVAHDDVSANAVTLVQLFHHASIFQIALDISGRTLHCFLGNFDLDLIGRLSKRKKLNLIMEMDGNIFAIEDDILRFGLPLVRRTAWRIFDVTLEKINSLIPLQQ